MIVKISFQFLQTNKFIIPIYSENVHLFHTEFGLDVCPMNEVPTYPRILPIQATDQEIPWNSTHFSQVSLCL